MKFLKNNCKIIIGFILGVLLTSSIVYAAVSANQISYTKQGVNANNVSEALNDLYSKISNEEKTITLNGNNTLDKYYKNLNVNVSLTHYSKSSIAASNIGNTTICDFIPQFLFLKVNYVNGNTNVHYIFWSTDNCQHFYLSTNSYTVTDDTKDFTISNNKIYLNSATWAKSGTYSMEYWAM